MDYSVVTRQAGWVTTNDVLQEDIIISYSWVVGMSKQMKNDQIAIIAIWAVTSHYVIVWQGVIMVATSFYVQD